jgi:HK97 family phage major capsid protein
MGTKMPRKRKEAAKLLAEAKAIEQKAREENRKLTDEEAAKFDALTADAGELLAEAKREEALEQLDAELSAERILAGRETTVRQATTDDDGLQGSERPARFAEPRDQEAEGRYGFGYFGEFAHAVVLACQRDQPVVDPRLLAMMAATGGSQGVPSDGGYLVPPTFNAAIWDGLRMMLLDLVSRTSQFTVTGESLSFPRNNETSRAGGTVYGGVLAAWIAEAAQITGSKPTFARLKLEPQELAVLIFQTDKLLRNSPIALEQYLQRAATEAISFKVNEAIVRGDGSGKPLGLLNSSGLITVAAEGGQNPDTIVFENVVKMYSRMHPARRPMSVWLHNQDIEPQLIGLQNPANNFPVFLPPGGLSSAPFGTLLGRPLLPVEHMSTLGDVGDIMLADLSAYATGLRGGVAGGIRSAVSMHLRFDFAETAFRFMFEIDGQPFVNTPLTPAQGSSTLSTHVTLAARA